MQLSNHGSQLNPSTTQTTTSKSLDSGYQILNAQQANERYGTDTGAFKRRLQGAMVVNDIKAVSRIIEMANRNNYKLWPISGGVNFGYGTALPAQNDNFILDLTALKAITFNPKTHSITIEPGVTQQDLANFLEDNDLPYMVPVTGLGPKGSLLGNALDGGYGLTPICDHFDGITEFEGIFGNGQWFNHQYRDLGCDDMAQSWSQGTGPNFTGLLRQGNFAVVCRATITLQRKPQSSRIIIMSWPSEIEFIKHQEAFSLAMEQIPAIGGIISLNAERVLSAHHDAPLASPLAGEQRQDYLTDTIKKRKLAAWTSVGTLYGGKYAVKGAVKDIKRLFPRAKVIALSPKSIKNIQSLSRFLPKRLFGELHRQIGSLQSSLGMLEGRPLSSFLQMAYALDDKGMEMNEHRNPAKDGQGILWYGPLVNIQAKQVKQYIDQMGAILAQYGFDNLLALTARSPQVHCGTIPLLFDKNDETSVARAKACYRSLVRLGINKGMPPYRIGVEYMQEIQPKAVVSHGEVLKVIAAQLDPNDIIAPGRYAH